MEYTVRVDRVQDVNLLTKDAGMLNQTSIYPERRQSAKDFLPAPQFKSKISQKECKWGVFS
jgi:hypothetical protein